MCALLAGWGLFRFSQIDICLFAEVIYTVYYQDDKEGKKQ